MTSPINSVSDHILDGIASGDLAASPFEVVSIAKELAARRAANTPVDGWAGRPIAEAPKDGTYILVRQDGVLEPSFYVVAFDQSWSDDGWWMTCDGKNPDLPLRGPEPVEWWPLPPASPALPSQVVEGEFPTEIWAGDFDAQGYGHAVAGMQGGLYERYVLASTCLTSPAAEPVGWETEAEWDLETRVFNAANNRDVPEWARKVVADVWKQYCLAANPAPSASREVTDEMVERAAQELLAHGEFSSIPWRNHDNALKAARAALLAALPEREG